MGGMLAATFLAIFFVPLFFRVITDLRIIDRRSRDELFAEIRHARHATHHTPPTPAHIPGHTPELGADRLEAPPIQPGPSHAD
jgi:hypothetical protein